MTEPTTPNRRFRFTVSTLLFAVLCFAGFFAGLRLGFDRGYSAAARQREAQVYTVTYSVADLVLPKDPDSAPIADFDPLIETITSIEPTSWDVSSGPGSIAPFEVNLSLVVSQTREIHARIADLLKQMHQQPARK